MIAFKHYNFEIPKYQDSLIDAMNNINEFFGGEYVNQNKNLLTILIRIQCNPILTTILDEEDQFLLNLIIKDLNNAQKTTHQQQSEVLNQIQNKNQELQRQFLNNLSLTKYKVNLSLSELKSIPNMKFVKKYSKLFQDDKASIDIEFQDNNDFEFLKFSWLPSVRQKYFRTFSNSSKENTDVLVELIKNRQKMAIDIYNEPDYLTRQIKQQTIQFNGDFQQKVKSIVKEIRKQTLYDIDKIKKLTREKDIRFYDVTYLKEKIKAIILANHPSNIQLLTCFTLENTLNGLQLLTKQIFKIKFEVKTILYGEENIETYKGIRLDLSQEDNIILFQIDIEGNGQVILDLFQNKYKSNHTSTSTYTEIGSSYLQNQKAVAYVADSLPRDTLYLSFDQVKNIFHEFGHALNIALSNTKYQYYSCARSTTDLVEIPSHFTELFLNEYQFVRQFAIDEITKMPIARSIFEKMLLCEELFKNLNLEETLYYTLLDIDLNSFKKDQEVSEQKLLEINKEEMTQTFSCNLKQQDKHFQIPKFTDNIDIESIISNKLYSKEDKMTTMDNIYNILFNDATNDTEENLNQNYQYDEEKIKDFEQNYMFTKFHHLFEYDATYYSYIVAKLCSQRLYNKYYQTYDTGSLPQEIEQLFTKGGFCNIKNKL